MEQIAYHGRRPELEAFRIDALVLARWDGVPSEIGSKMKMKLFVACLLGLSFGISALPAQALNISFGNYDHNHDGHWDRTEYYNANRDWHRHHDHRYLPRNEVYRQYGTYDRDHDGYLSPGEVTRIHTW